MHAPRAGSRRPPVMTFVMVWARQWAYDRGTGQAQRDMAPCTTGGARCTPCAHPACWAQPPGETGVVTQIIIGIAVLALLIYRQLRTRAQVNASGLRLAAIIGAIGLIEAYQFIDKHLAR